MKLAENCFSLDQGGFGVKTFTPFDSVLVQIFENLDISIFFYGPFCLVKALKVVCRLISFAGIENRGGEPLPLIEIGCFYQF